MFPHKPEELDEYFNNPKIKIDKANNEYFQIAVTMGVPALIVYLTFLFLILKSGFKDLFLVKGDQQFLLLGLLLAVIGYIIQAFFNISTVPVAPYFWIFLGLLYRLSIDIIDETTEG